MVALDEWPGSGGGWRTNEERELRSRAFAFSLELYGNYVYRIQNRQRMKSYRRRIGMHRDADGAGTGLGGDGRIRMGMSYFQPCHYQGDQDASEGDEALQLAGLELALTNHVWPFCPYPAPRI